MVKQKTMVTKNKTMVKQNNGQSCDTLNGFLKKLFMVLAATTLYFFNCLFCYFCPSMFVCLICLYQGLFFAFMC